MNNLDNIASIPPGALLYFHYGLAFIFLGMAITAKDMKGSRLTLAGSLKYLAVFGFAHGTHEWLELYILLQEKLMSVDAIRLTKTLGFFFGLLSYLSLLQFGYSLMIRLDKANLNWLRPLGIFIPLTWLGALLYLFFNEQEMSLLFLKKVDISTRLSFTFTGSMLTALALTLYARRIKGIHEITAKNLSLAAIVFFFYGLLAGLIPSKTILPLLHIPVELLRMIAAILITLFMTKALNLFDIETRQKVVDQMRELAQSEKLASLGQLATGVAHEINNPLTNASLNVQMLRQHLEKEHSDEVVFNKIDAVSRNIERASTIAKELLYFSRFDKGFEKVHINRTLQKALAALDYKFDTIDISLHLGDVPEIFGDADKLQQVFINILNNAVEAMQGRGKITIGTIFKNSMVAITIQDNGPGISEEKQIKLFDPFFTTKEIGRGTGLGLFICYGIVNQHNGTISITSTVQKGTVVDISLPIFEKSP